MATISIIPAQDFTRIGETHIFSSIPFRTWGDWYGVVASVTGATGTRFLDVSVRYSHDAVKFTDWEDISALDAIISANPHVLGERDDFIVEVRAIRGGTDDTGIVTLDQVDCDGTPDPTFLVLDDDMVGTVFEEIKWDDEDWNFTWMNLLRKLYHYGVVPNYIERENSLTADDEDYIAWFKTMAYYYAYIIVLGNRKIGGIYDDQTLLRQYLRQRDTMVCEDESLAHMQAVVNELFVNFRQRGTNLVASVQDVTINQDFHGELRRIVCWKQDECDEFVYEFMPPNLRGIVVNQTSPTGTETLGHIQMDKMPEAGTVDIVDLSKYTTTGASIVTHLGTPIGDVDGVDFTQKFGVFDAAPYDNWLPVHPNLTYEWSFWLKQTGGAANNITLQANTRDCDNNIVQLRHSRTLANLSNFQVSGSTANHNNWYFYRLLIVAEDVAPFAAGEDQAVMGGTHLKFSAGAAKIGLNMKNETGDVLSVIDMRFKPAYLPASPAWVDPMYVAALYAKNKNSEFSDIRLRDEVERALMQYGTRVLINYLPL